MGNNVQSVKNNISAQSQALRMNTWWHFGVGEVEKGQTSNTDFWAAINPPSQLGQNGSSTVYMNKASQGPSIMTFANPTELEIFTERRFNTANLPGLKEVVEEYIGLTGAALVSRKFPEITTNNLQMFWDCNQWMCNRPGNQANACYDLSQNQFVSATSVLATVGYSEAFPWYVEFDPTAASHYVRWPSMGDPLSGRDGWTMSIWWWNGGFPWTPDQVLIQFGPNHILYLVGPDQSDIAYSWQTSGGTLSFVSTGLAPTSQWNNVIFVYGGGKVRIIHNGDFVNDYETALSGTISGSGGTPIIGAKDTIGSGQLFGRISNCLMWGTTLSDAQLTQLWNEYAADFGF